MSDRRTLSGVVADHFIRQIREGVYAPGDGLPTLKEIAAEHGVGYGVAREAMQHLVALGLVDVRPRRGAVLLDIDARAGLDDSTLAMLLSDQAVDELYALRLLVEVAVAGQAAERATPEHLADIVHAQQVFEETLAAGEPHFTADVELHAAIARASGNRLFLRVLDALKGVLTEVRSKTGIVPGSAQVAQAEHAAVVQAIIDRDPVAARAAMRRHIETATATVHRAWLTAQPPNGAADGRPAPGAHQPAAKPSRPARGVNGSVTSRGLRDR